MKSKIDVRVFAVEKAVAVMGLGSPLKDIIEKAKEIEAYVVSEADLPETYDEMKEGGEIISRMFKANSTAEV